MHEASLDQFLEKSFPIANNLVLTVSAAPENETQLFKVLESAVVHGFDGRGHLREIQLTMERFPSIDSKFWHVPVEDSGKEPLLSFLFEIPSDVIQ